MSGIDESPEDEYLSEHMFDTRCLDCRTPVTLPERPGDGTCPSCQLRMYLTEDGALGRYPDAGWKPGDIQGRRPRGRDESGMV